MRGGQWSNIQNGTGSLHIYGILSFLPISDLSQVYYYYFVVMLIKFICEF